MALTRDFKQTINARAHRDATFRREFLREGIESMLAGDLDTGKAILHEYINVTVGFTELAQVTHRSPKSLMRMLRTKGNPREQNFFQIVAYLVNLEGVRFKLHVDKGTKARLRQPGILPTTQLKAQS